MADFLDKKRSEIAARLKELKPVVDEYARLEAALAALAGVPSPVAAPASSGGGRRVATATAASRSRKAAPGRTRGRPKGTGTRANEALALVNATPGITIPQIAVKMGIKRHYLYRLLPSLETNGLIEKDGRGWRPKAAA
jgi:hypothetical protein